MREQREPVGPHVPVAGRPGAALNSHWLARWYNPNQSRDTTLRSRNIGFCDWPKRLAPLESVEAVVGVECEQFEP